MAIEFPGIALEDPWGGIDNLGRPQWLLFLGKSTGESCTEREHQRLAEGSPQVFS